MLLAVNNLVDKFEVEVEYKTLNSTQSFYADSYERLNYKSKLKQYKVFKIILLQGALA